MNLIYHSIIGIFLLFSSYAICATHTDSVEIQFGIFDHPPYAYKNDQGDYVGTLYEVATAILTRANLPGSNQVLPSTRLFQQLSKGDTDCSLMIKNKITQSNFNLIEPIGEIVSTGITPRSGITLNRYEDLSNIKIAVPRGIYIYEPFDNDEALKKIWSTNYEHSASMLQRGRVDSMAGVVESMLFNTRKLGMKAHEVGESLVFARYPIWLLCAHNSVEPDVIQQMKDAVSSLREDGTIRGIFNFHVQ